MNKGLNPFKTDADLEHAWVSALFDEQIHDPMHSTRSENELKNYGNDAKVMMTIVKSTIKELIAKEVDRIHAECTEAEVQTQI